MLWVLNQYMEILAVKQNRIAGYSDKTIFKEKNLRNSTKKK